MTKLLATIEQTEALEFARALILRGHRNDGESGSFFEAAESRAFVRKFLRIMLLTVEGRLDLLALARAGEEDAQIILRNTILEIKSRLEPLPAEFIGYDMELIAGKVPPPRSGPGPDRRNELLRNISIATTVAAVCDRYSLKPTGRSMRKRSACSIVAEALAVIHMAIGYKAVETIWKKYGRYMPGPGWVAAMGPLP
jgi:hypothetical protein